MRWASADQSIAGMTPDGVLTPVHVGQATVSVVDGVAGGQLAIDVWNICSGPAPAQVTPFISPIYPADLRIPVGRAYTFRVLSEVTPSDCQYEISDHVTLSTSHDPSIVRIENGTTLHPLAAGGTDVSVYVDGWEYQLHVEVE